MAAPKNKSINLLFHEGFEYSTIGKILNWSLSAGRAIVVLTEFVVIAAFLSRFWLDRSLTDLIEQVESKRIQIESSASFEKDFRSTQNKLATFKSLDNEKTNAAKIIKDAAQSLPQEVVLASVSFSENGIQIRGLSFSENGIASFMKALEKRGYKNLVLSDIALETRAQKILSFTLKAETEKKQAGAEETEKDNVN